MYGLPFLVGKILELPLTTTQDYSLFNILNYYSIRLWKEQISLILGKHGLISFIIHPDYNIELAARRVYSELLEHLSELRSEGETWIALPRDVAEWWRLRSELNLVNVGGSWRIEGKGSERARLAYAVINEKLVDLLTSLVRRSAKRLTAFQFLQESLTEPRNVESSESKFSGPVAMLTCDVTIIGAGPYGLSAAAHLRQVKGLDVRVFGEPMSFWECNMPAGDAPQFELDGYPNCGSVEITDARSIPSGD